MCDTSPFRPTILTAKDDDTVGQTIAGSTGSPFSHCGNPALRMMVSGTHVHDLRIAHAPTGIYL